MTDQKISTENNSTCHVHDDPEIFTMNNFLKKSECNHFIEISKHKMKESLVSNEQGGFKSDGRTSTNTWIPHKYDAVT